MARRITDDCTSCGACEPECENGAISEGKGMFVIDPDKCTECVGIAASPKCVEACGVDASQPDPRHVETHEQLLAKWRRLHPGQEPLV